MNPENKVTPSSCLEYYSHLPEQNSIPLHAFHGEREKKVMIFTAGTKQRPRYVVPEHQAPVDVLTSLHDLCNPNLCTRDNQS